MSLSEKVFGIFGLSKKKAIGCKGSFNTKEIMKKTNVFNIEGSIEVVYNRRNNSL